MFALIYGQRKEAINTGTTALFSHMKGELLQITKRPCHFTYILSAFFLFQSNDPFEVNYVLPN